VVELFNNDEIGYLSWIEANPQGFVANADRSLSFPQYPMVHTASHRLVSSPKIGNFTTGDYVKFCSTDLDALERYSQTEFGRPLTRCSQCMSGAA
jgi:hypothetical protein